jgi:hypothetical protein
MSSRIPRREALQQLAVLSVSALAPAGLLACSRKASCTDVTGLGTDDVNQRINVASYVDQAPDPAKKCVLCVQFIAATAPNACGLCKVVKGPINPDGTCKLFVAKPA